jgi:hypothetical protein
MAASIKMAVFWDVVPCSLVEVITLMIEAASTSEMSVNFYQTTWRKNPEDSHLQHSTYDSTLKFMKGFTTRNASIEPILFRKTYSQTGWQMQPSERYY